jgi:hypothetical protein
MRPSNQAGPQLPTLEPWMRTLLMALFGLFVLEVVLRFGGLDLSFLGWFPLGLSFEGWQPLTHFLVFGPGAGSVYQVLLGLLILYFTLPAMGATLTQRQLAGAAGTIAVVAAAVAFLADLLGLVHGPAFGWISVSIGLIVLFGLARPTATILLFFVLPVSGKVIVWGTLGIDVLVYLAEPTLGTAEGVGAWVGAVGWWQLMGPGAKRRVLKAKKAHIEKELRRFEVIEGGRSQETQGDQGDQDDRWVH